MAHAPAAGNGARDCRRKARRYLVTGGLGYAGAWFTSRLAARGHDVFVLSHRERENGPPGLGGAYAFIKADLAGATPERLAGELPGALDGIIHAASLNDAFVPDYPGRALSVNGLGTRNLLEALCLRRGETGEPFPLLVYCSTFHVYGAACGHITEATPPAPRNDYALTHYIGEEYCRMYTRVRGLPSVIVRMTNGYGAPKTPDCGKWHLLLNDLCRQAYEEGKITLRSHPATPRDFLWLGDAAAALEHLLARPDLAGGIFNIASGTSRSLGEVARLAAAAAEEVLGRHVSVDFAHTGGEAGPCSLFVSNDAVRAATGLEFYDKMREEASALVRLLAGA